MFEAILLTVITAATPLVIAALGELVTCPHCIGLWAASGFAYSLVLFPRQTRLVTTIFGAQAVADFLNAAFVRLHDR